MFLEKEFRPEWRIETKLDAMTLMVAFLSFLLSSSFAYAESAAGITKAQTIYNNLNQVLKPTTDAVITQMAQKIDAGDLTGAAHLASSDDHFITITIRRLASVMKTRTENASVPLGDFDSTFMGVARDGLDARRLLTDNINYTYSNITPAVSANNNTHYATADSTLSFQEGSAQNLSANLLQGQLSIQTSSTPLPAEQIAGVLTSRDYFVGFGVAGTNRALYEHSLRAFECVSLRSVANAGLPSDRVRQDVDIASQNFQTTCATCHNHQDRANPFNFFAFTNNNAMLPATDPNSPTNVGQIAFKTGTDISVKPNIPLFDANGVALKVTRNATVNPLGYHNTDDSWFSSLGAENKSATALGVNLVSSGNGVHLFGQMLASSSGFAYCMAERAFTQMCLRKDFNPDQLADSDYAYLNANASTIQAGSDVLVGSGYNLKTMFEYLAGTAPCVGQ